MFCPFCQAEDTKVIDSRLVTDGTQIRRRRSCEVCQSRFTTFETADLALPRVIKSNGERQPFNGSKLKKGMLRALEKRPLSVEEIDSVFGKILKEIRTRGVREIKSIEIGEIMMNALKDVDPKSEIEIFTDSQYVKLGITEWINTWVNNNWKTSKKENVKNKDLWLELYNLNQSLKIKWNWVKAHPGNPINE